jgi:Transposase IS4
MNSKKRILGLVVIMYAIELVEGEDSPPQLSSKEFNNVGKTIGLLLWMTMRLWNTGKLVVPYSGFCVLQGIVELRHCGVFSAALIKKRRYWPKYIQGDVIKQHFEDKEVGSVDSIGGTRFGIPFDVFCMKDDGCVMVSNYGTNESTGKRKKPCR